MEQQQRNYGYKFLRMTEKTGGPFKERTRIVHIIKKDEDPIFLGHITHDKEQEWAIQVAPIPNHLPHVEEKWLPDLTSMFADLKRRDNGDEVLSDEEKAVKK